MFLSAQRIGTCLSNNLPKRSLSLTVSITPFMVCHLLVRALCPMAMFRDSSVVVWFACRAPMARFTTPRENA